MEVLCKAYKGMLQGYTAGIREALLSSSNLETVLDSELYPLEDLRDPWDAEPGTGVQGHCPDHLVMLAGRGF